MMAFKILSLVLTCAVCQIFLTSKLLATSSKRSSSVSLSLSEKYFYYEEPSFMKSYGFMTGIDISFSSEREKGFYAEGLISSHFGDSTYHGSIQKLAGDHIEFSPYSTKNKNSSSLIYLDGKFGYGFQPSHSIAIIPYAGLSFRNYTLNISEDVSQSLAKEERVTRNGFYFIGVIFNFIASEHFNVSAETAIGGSTSASVAYKNFCHGNTENCKNFDLEDGLYIQASSQANWFFTDKLNLITSIAYKYYKFGKSKNDLLLITPEGPLKMKEPESVNHDISFGIGLAYHFS